MIVSTDFEDGRGIRTYIWTCAPEKTDEFQIEMRENGLTAKDFIGGYAIINVLNSGNVISPLLVYFKDEIGDEHSNYCISGYNHKVTSNTSYEETNIGIDYDKDVAGWRYTKILNLSDSSTLIWSHHVESNEDNTGTLDEIYYEFTLKRVN